MQWRHTPRTSLPSTNQYEPCALRACSFFSQCWRRRKWRTAVEYSLNAYCMCHLFWGLCTGNITPQQPQDSPGITFAVNRLARQIQVWHVIHHCTRTNFERHQVGLKITESPTEMMARQLSIENETILPILRRCLYEHWWPQNDVRLCILNKRGAVIWTSKKQSTIGLKAEYVEASREKPCGWNTPGKLGSVQKQPTRNLVQEGIINFESCWDPDQTADVLTKALP